MRYFKFQKLVRDKIVDGMKENNQEPRGVRVLEDGEYIERLIDKIIEESSEMKGLSKEDLASELADLQEIIDSIAKFIGMSKAEIKELQKAKLKKAGGFDKRLYVEDVGVEENDKWIRYYEANSHKYPEVKG